MKIKNVLDQILNKINILCYISNLCSKKGCVFISYAIPRWTKDNYNWGDDVNSILCSKLSAKSIIPYQYSLLKREHYMCIGSVIQWYTDENAVIWGSGLLYPVNNLRIPKKVLAVRGPLTRECLLKNGIDCPEIYGDPALLFPRFYTPCVDKKYKIGVICHFSELDNLKKSSWKNIEGVLFIDIRSYGLWSDFIDKIVSCEYILSSSLHGVIISDAYSIPNLWSQFSSYGGESSKFKFMDYYLSVQKTDISNPTTITPDLPIGDVIQIVKSQWKKPIIDVDLLLSVNPFTNKI